MDVFIYQSRNDVEGYRYQEGFETSSTIEGPLEGIVPVFLEDREGERGGILTSVSAASELTSAILDGCSSTPVSRPTSGTETLMTCFPVGG